MRSKTSSQNRFIRIITIPIRALCKAKDFYVRSMVECAERGTYGGSILSGPSSSGHISTLPKSFSVRSSRSDDTEDLRELIRAVSARSSSGSAMDFYSEQQLLLRQCTATGIGMGTGPKRVPRSCSVGMGKIDEDKAVDFGAEEESGFGVNNNRKKTAEQYMYPRSRSYAVTNNNRRSVVF